MERKPRDWLRGYLLEIRLDQQDKPAKNALTQRRDSHLLSKLSSNLPMLKCLNEHLLVLRLERIIYRIQTKNLAKKLRVKSLLSL